MQESYLHTMEFGVNTPESERLNSTTTLGTNVSKTVIGTSINITGTTVNTLFGSNTENAMVFGTVSNLPTLFTTNNTERMLLKSNGGIQQQSHVSTSNRKEEVFS